MNTRRTVTTGSKYEEMAGYSRAVIEDDGWIFVSGTVGYNFETGELPETAGEQAKQSLATIGWALSEAGAGFADIVRVRVYVPDPEDVVAVSQVLKSTLEPNRPANTTVCSPLAVPECKVEIEVTARVRG